MGPPGRERARRRVCCGSDLGRPAISTGEMLRDEISARLGVGNAGASDFMDKGELVPDDVMIGVIEERLTAPGLRARLHPRRLSAHRRRRRMRSTRCSAQHRAARSSTPCSLAVPNDELVKRLVGPAHLPRVRRDVPHHLRPADERRALRQAATASSISATTTTRTSSRSRLDVYEARPRRARVLPRARRCCVEVDGIGGARRRARAHPDAGGSLRVHDPAEGARRDRDHARGERRSSPRCSPS